jgi:hypothetical protein
MVAITVLVAVLVPALLLVTKSTTVVYDNKFGVTAANLANSQLETERNLAIAGSLPPQASTTTKSVPATSGELYTIIQSAGWCQPSGAGGWTTYSGSGNPYAYGVSVTVKWKQNYNTTTGLTPGVQVAGIVTTPGVTNPTANPTATCPLP